MYGEENIHTQNTEEKQSIWMAESQQTKKHGWGTSYWGARNKDGCV